MGQTMDSSSAVRVMEVKSTVGLGAGIGASGAKRQTVKLAGRRRNLSCMKAPGRKDLVELCSAWTGRRPVSPQSQVVPTAFITAALASRRVESRVGSDEESGVTSSGISVQPSTTASQPRSANARITS